MTKRKCRRFGVQLLVFLLVFFLLPSVFAQQSSRFILHGVVVDQKEEPVIGATIAIAGTTQGTISGLDGDFKLEVAPNSTLVISYIGYITREVKVSDKGPLKIILSENEQLLDEVVVIGYGSVKKEDLTGSVAAIKIDEMNKGMATSPQDLLAGKIAGVSVSSTGGQPGAGSTIRIRGGSSLSAKNDPLVIIDGVIMSSETVKGLSNPLSTVNPADIETFTVLKDASATAIYGSRASNGVIIITTKKGTTDQVKFSYNGNVTVSKARKLFDLLDGDEFRELMRSLPDYTDAMAKALDLYPNQNTDWQKEIYRTSISTDHNLSAYGSFTKVLPYRISTGFTNDQGILKTSDFERYSGSISLTPTLFDSHLKINANAKGSYIKNHFGNTGAIGSAYQFDPTKPVKNDNTLYGGYFTWTNDLKPDGPRKASVGFNPVSMLEMTNDRSTVKSFVGNTQFDYTLHGLPELRFNLNLAIDHSNGAQNRYVSPNAPSDFGEALDKSGSENIENMTLNNTLLEFYSQYSKDLNLINSHFDLMGGYSYQKLSREGDQVNYYLSRDPENFGERTSERNKFNAWGPNKAVLISFYGRLNYSLLDKYLLTFTLRQDGSSRFSKNNRWGTFPSLALGWKMNEEGFLKQIEFLSTLKMRLGWGLTGQQDLGDAFFFPSSSSYSWGKGGAMFPQYDAQGNATWTNVIKPTPSNPNLKWEQTTTWNAGLDYGFLNNRINGTIDVYYRKTKNLLNREVPMAAGVIFGEFIPQNIGSLENKGFEVMINAIPVSMKDFVWDLGFNLTYNKSEITSLTFDDALSTVAGFRYEGIPGDKRIKIHSVGHPVGTFYVYEQIYDKDGKPIEGAYVDHNNDGIINDDDLYHYKTPFADVLMGFNSKFTYKKWDLGFNGRISLGNYNYNQIAAENSAITGIQIFSNDALSNRSHYALETNFKNRQFLSDYYVQNASFLKIDNITLGYSCKVAKKVDARLFGIVQNPIVLTKYKGLDPEAAGYDIDGIFSMGMDRNLYPRPISFILGVNLNF